MANQNPEATATDAGPPLGGYDRYAIYWVPQPGEPLAQAGAAWLGWDPSTGERDPAREADGRVAAPRRYGLHATLKAPFRLAEDRSVEDLDNALASFAAARRTAIGPGLGLDDGLGFMALRPLAPSPQIDNLAADCVTVFDRFRAPVTPEDRMRAGADRMSPRQRALFEAHGYQYILDLFRFHITLTGPLSAEQISETALELNDRFGSLLTPAFRIHTITLLGDPGGEAGFRLLRHYALTG
ncbi:MAG: DUF1045 domain-containing protein [Pseudomonadota bacterium]